MTKHSSKQWDELLRIRDVLADAVDAANEKELVDDLVASGQNPEKALARSQALLESAAKAAGKLHLRQAQAALKQGRAKQGGRRVVGIVEARAKLKQLVGSGASFPGGLMLAARNAGAKGIDEMSDNDVLVMYEMAIATGHIPSDDGQ